MATIGSFDLNVGTLGRSTNEATRIVAKVTEELANQGSLIGLGIAIAVALVLIFGAVFVALNVIPRLIGKIKGLRGA